MKLICCSENKSRPRTSWNESPTHSGIGGGSLRGPSPYENTSRNPAAVRTPSPTRDVNAAGFLSYAPNNQKRTVYNKQPRTGVFISMIGSDSEEDTVHQPPKRLRLV